MVGDACLLSVGRSTEFRIGIGTFLLAHLAYAVAFSQLGLDPTGLLITNDLASSTGQTVILQNVDISVSGAYTAVVAAVGGTVGS